jgi:SH3-like domain-containing protein
MYREHAEMSASHFFVGLGAGIAILAVPVAMLTPGSTVPQHIVDWIEGPAPQIAQLSTDDAAANRPLRGYQQGEPTPAADTVPTVQPRAVPTRVPPPTPQPLVNAPALSTLRWAGTGVIRATGAPVLVRQVPGVETAGDATIADGSPVLISAGPPLQVGSDQWRAIRGLNGVVGWVPSTQVAVDGEAPIYVGATPTPPGSPTAAPAQRSIIANTGGAGVVLRNSPNDADRTRAGLMDGAVVQVLGNSGEWVRVRDEKGQEGWVPVQYVAATR